jgi:ABC-type branched-subunit amino acid transport system ATPase component/ABC-type branched-subunit amino acid transport system permease subunit
MSKSLSSVRLPVRPSAVHLFPVAFVLVLFLMPQLFGNGSVRLIQYELVLSFIMVGVALNIAMAYAGQFVIGITSVFAVGAYAAAFVVKHHASGVGLVPMLLIGAVVGAVGGLIIGLPALRVGGFYLALVSLYAALAIPDVAQNTSSLGGLTGIPVYTLPGFSPKLSGETLYLIILIIVLLSSVLSWALVHSRVGRRFMALSSSSQLSASIGISGYRTKLLALLISSTLAGTAGGIYIYTQQFIGPTSATPGIAILVLAGLVIGGAGTTFGPLLGGVLVLGLNQFLTAFASYNGIIFGGLLMGCAVFLPNGLTDRLDALAIRLKLKQSHHASSRAASARDTARVTAVQPLLTPVVGAGNASPLEVEAVRKSFGGVTAVDDVDLTVERGVIHGLIGSNGSGKTTMLNLISGFYRVDSGRIHLGDLDLTRQPAYERAHAGIARTFQSPKLMLERSAIDNVVVAAELRLRCSGLLSMLRVGKGRRTNRRAYEEAAAVLEWMELIHLRDVPAGELPHGTRRLVELARVIALRPSFVLLDEPAAGLSPIELNLLKESIQGLADAGTGILLIEHNVPMVLEIAREVTVLHQGNRLAHGTPAELRRNEQVASAFLGIDMDALETPR